MMMEEACDSDEMPNTQPTATEEEEEDDQTTESEEEDDEQETQPEAESGAKNEVYGYLFVLSDWISDRKKIVVDKDDFKVGRASSCDFKVAEFESWKQNFYHLNVSRKHFAIRTRNGRCSLKCESVNGVYINGEKYDQDEIVNLPNYVTIGFSKFSQQNFAFHPIYVQKEQRYSTSLRKSYVVSKVLGKGGCGVVRLAFRKKDYAPMAVKIIKKSQMSATEKREVALLRKIGKHPCIVRVEEVIESVKNLHFILEFAAEGDLFEKITDLKVLPPPEAKWISAQVFHAIKYLHGLKIAHRDLKPENILVFPYPHGRFDYTVKVTDFGLSKIMCSTSALKSFVGTTSYLAPEVLQNRGLQKYKRSPYGLEVDLWSMGVLIITLLTGKKPFQNENESDLINQVSEGLYSISEEKQKVIGPLGLDFIQNLLSIDPDERPSADEALKDKWFTTEPGLTQDLRQLFQIWSSEKENESPGGSDQLRKRRKLQ